MKVAIETLDEGMSYGMMSQIKKYKDTDPRLTKKNNETFYGYKNHAKVDTKSKFIDNYKVPDASVHDSQPFDELLSKKDEEQDLHTDGTYTNEKQEKVISKYKIKNRVHEEGYRNKPLIKEQKTNNTEKSETKARVEHVFKYFEYWLHLNKTQTSLFLFSVCTIFEVYRANHE